MTHSADRAISSAGSLRGGLETGRLGNRFARELPELCVSWRAEAFERATCLVVDRLLAEELGLDPDWLTTRDGAAFLSGRIETPGSTPVAMAYAGHQFGNYSPRLGDGRALLLGEITDRAGRLCDLHLKGSGRTPFARGGDGRAAVGPMLRESVMGRAMHALGIPTTRALAVLATGDRIARDGRALPGAILVRVAASHLRVGSFEYAAARNEAGLLRRLADHAIARHCPEAHESENPALALYESVCMRQAELVARWMLVGFVHGVMNTDNTTISGETIDYGPCAFMDRHAAATVFSSIDQTGRYAYGNQPGILQWNLARLAEAMLPLFDDDPDRAVGLATAALERFAERFSSCCRTGMAAKLGIGLGEAGEDAGRAAAKEALVDGVPALLEAQRVDHTLFFRRLSLALRGDAEPVRSLFADPAAFDAWTGGWRALLPASEVELVRIADAMDRLNPIYVPRNHRVELALDAATEGDLAPLSALMDALSRPFDERPGLEPFAEPAPADAPRHRTYCGT